MKGWSVTACSLPEGMRDILKVTELDQAMNIIDIIELAFAAAGIAGDDCGANTEPGVPTSIDTSNWARPVSILTPPRIKGAKP